MSLFDGCKLPDDERALEILDRISELWENNAGVKSVCTPQYPNPSIRYQSVPVQLKEELIKLSMTIPKTLEDMLNDEVSLHNILRFAEGKNIN